MKILAVIPSKGRCDVFEKYAKPFVLSLGIDSVVVLEKDDYKNYNYPKKILLKEQNKGLPYSLQKAKEYAIENKYDLVFKIDDDVKSIGNVKDDLTEIIKHFSKYPTLGAITFPYDFEFYNKTNKIFNYINKRMQTAYIIRVSAWVMANPKSTFEDFYSYMMLRKNNFFTLQNGRNMIKCKPVGGGNGGLQAKVFDRRKLALETIKEMQKIDPTIEIAIKEQKPWYYEPKFTGEEYKAKKI